jgi:hypothetical protein
MLTNQNFGPVKQGDTFRVNFRLLDTDGKTPLLYADLFGCDLTWRWSRMESGTTIGVVDGSLIDIGNGAAAAQVLIPTEDVGVFFHELQMILLGDISTVATGMFSIDEDID